MRLPGPLIEARLIRRYKRFLADVALAEGATVTAHCADPGRLPGLLPEGAPVWLSRSGDPRRKLPHRLEIVEQEGALVGLNTMNANRLVAEAIEAGGIDGLALSGTVRPEPRIVDGTRLDFHITTGRGPDTFIEVKNVTWRRDGDLAAFPDAVTRRGGRHLEALGRLAGAGHRAVLLFVAQRRDVGRLTVAGDIDPAYAAAYRTAVAMGLTVRALRCDVNQKEIRLENTIPLV